ncbi:MAG: HYR domain-containing protein [Verrucomicrobia bacterium]|nr:HYR domain-containing protein [Verrucomicrobiota bacterium]
MLIALASGTAAHGDPAVTFSRPVPNLVPHVPSRTCIIGNFDVSPPAHHWKLHFRGPGTEAQTVPLEVVATAVNPAETGAVKASVTDESGLQTISVPHLPSGDNPGVLNLTLLPGGIYDLAVERVEPSQGPVAHHYKLGSPDRRLELGWEDPIRYIEPPYQAWAVNADAGENVSLEFFNDGVGFPEEGGGVDPIGVTLGIDSTDCTEIFPIQGFLLPTTITLPNFAGGTLILYVKGSAHYQMRKNSGSDRGFYALPCAGENRAPVARCRDVTIVLPPDKCSAFALINDGSFDPDEDPLFIKQDPPGPYLIGQTKVTLLVSDGRCRGMSSCTAYVTVRDVTPPRIECPRDLVLKTAPGRCSAPEVKFSVFATDTCAGRVLPVCLPPSGSEFPKGTTVVNCTAMDPSGNVSKCSFKITVVDAEPPMVKCVPTTNPAGETIPRAGENPSSGRNPDGFYQLFAADNCDGVNLLIYVKDSAEGPCGGAFVAGPYQPGTKVKLTQSPGRADVKPMAGEIVAHINTRGEPVLVVKDSAGNQRCHLCFVPPPPK